MDDSGLQLSEDEKAWARLTERHRACLDLLLERMTSKMIARELQISKDTVDQRITAARDILGARDRNEAALVYARLKAIYHRVVYDPVEVAREAEPVRPALSDGVSPSMLPLGDSSAMPREAPGASSLSGKIWRSDHGVKHRLLIIATVFAAVVVIVLLGLGIAQSLSQLLSG
jgi:DNA-binding CsgD family transcriptional regulator